MIETKTTKIRRIWIDEQGQKHDLFRRTVIDIETGDVIEEDSKEVILPADYAPVEEEIGEGETTFLDRIINAVDRFLKNTLLEDEKEEEPWPE